METTRIMNQLKDDLQCLVFRTSLSDRLEVEEVSGILNDLPGIKEWYVDLDDREKVLRIECSGITDSIIIETLRNIGVSAEIMPAERIVR